MANLGRRQQRSARGNGQEFGEETELWNAIKKDLSKISSVIDDANIGVGKIHELEATLKARPESEIGLQRCS